MYLIIGSHLNIEFTVVKLAQQIVNIIILSLKSLDRRMTLDWENSIEF